MWVCNTASNTSSSLNSYTSTHMYVRVCVYDECERLEDKTPTHASESACEGVCKKERTCARKTECSRQGATVALACVHVHSSIHIYIYTCHAKVASKTGKSRMLSATDVFQEASAESLDGTYPAYLYQRLHLYLCTYTHN